jgi:hypothetical protein
VSPAALLPPAGVGTESGRWAASVAGKTIKVTMAACATALAWFAMDHSVE